MKRTREHENEDQPTDSWISSNMFSNRHPKCLLVTLKRISKNRDLCSFTSCNPFLEPEDFGNNWCATSYMYADVNAVYQGDNSNLRTFSDMNKGCSKYIADKWLRNSTATPSTAYHISHSHAAFHCFRSGHYSLPLESWMCTDIPCQAYAHIQGYSKWSHAAYCRNYQGAVVINANILIVDLLDTCNSVFKTHLPLEIIGIVTEYSVPMYLYSLFCDAINITPTNICLSNVA